MRPTPATLILAALLASSSVAQTQPTYDEPGPGKSNVSPTARPSARRTTTTVPAATTSPKTTPSTGRVRSAHAPRTSAMSVDARPGGRWIRVQKIYKEGFGKMGLTFGRIMPIGLARIPDDVVGKVRPSMALLDSPRRFLTDTPMTNDAPLAVLHNRRKFEPQLIRGYIERGEYDKLAPVANLSSAERGRVSRARVEEERFERSFREVTRRISGVGPMAPNERIGSGISDPKLRPVEEEGLRPSRIGTKTAAALEDLAAHVKTYPDDFHAQRLLALAHLVDRDTATAAATMAKAYESDPLLVNEPLDLAACGLESSQVPPLLSLALSHANKDPAKAHLLTLVLQQAQGHKDKAKATLERARKAGLSPELADLFAEALR